MDEPASSRPGVIAGKQPRNHFYLSKDTRDDCPGAGASCRGKAYVVPGDKVIVAESKTPGFVCAAFVSKRGNATVGWLPADTVEMRPVAQPSVAHWLGKWTYLNSNIVIKRGKAAGSLSIDGDSFSKRYQAVNTGEIFAEDVVPKGNTLAFAEKAGETVPIEQADKTDCALTFALVYDVLVVSDSGNCGGAGVYFTGFYRRKR